MSEVKTTAEKQKDIITEYKKEFGEEKFKAKAQARGLEPKSIDDGKVENQMLFELCGELIADLKAKNKDFTTNTPKDQAETQAQIKRKEGKSLDERAVYISEKKYILVADRIEYFSRKYTNGYITTDIITEANGSIIVIKATITPDTKNSDRYFVGHARTDLSKSTKKDPLEDCETSAIGRALGIMGIGIFGSVASAENIFDLQEGEKK